LSHLKFIGASVRLVLIPMSDENGLTLFKLATYLVGIIIFALGFVLTYFSMTAEIGVVSPRLFAPLGVLVVIAGGLLLLMRGD
jgi:hypothetical protein